MSATVQRPVLDQIALPTVPGFEIHALIGRGASGMVWRATQHGTLREVAVKILTPFWSGHALAELRFAREAEIAASLEHDCIAAIFGAGDSPAGPWLAMELVRGSAADEWVAATRPPLRERVVFFRAICDAIAHAHQRGIIHRDLKPANVLVSADGLPKVVDFGFASRDAAGSLELSLTQHGEVFGTLGWMPPEQAAGRWHEVDALSDVFALGALFFTLLTLESPVDAALPAAVRLAQAQTGERRRLRDCLPEAPRDLDALIATCMAPQKSRRYQSAAELMADLDRWLAGEPLLVPTVDRLYWTRKKLRLHWKAVAAFGVATLTCLGMAWGYWSGKSRLDGEKRAALQRESEQRARTLHEAQELITQLLVEMQPHFDAAGHPEWIKAAERRVAAFPWDDGRGEAGGAYDSRRFLGRTALLRGEAAAASGDWANAHRHYRTASGYFRALATEQPRAVIFREEFARATIGFSSASGRLGFLKEAFQQLAKALPLFRPANAPSVSFEVEADFVAALKALAEPSGRNPQHAGTAIALADEATSLLRGDASISSAETEANLAALATLKARLLSGLQKNDEGRQAADTAVAHGRKAQELSKNGESARIALATALTAWGEIAVRRDDAVKACDPLTEATDLLKSIKPVGSVLVPELVNLAEAWESVQANVSAHGLTQWAFDANERAIAAWTAIHDRRATPETVSGLTRTYLLGSTLASKCQNRELAVRNANQVLRVHRHASDSGLVRISTLLDAVDAALLLHALNEPRADSRASPRETAEALWKTAAAGSLPLTKADRQHRAALEGRMRELAAGVTLTVP